MSIACSSSALWRFEHVKPAWSDISSTAERTPRPVLLSWHSTTPTRTPTPTRTSWPPSSRGSSRECRRVGGLPCSASHALSQPAVCCRVRSVLPVCPFVVSFSTSRTRTRILATLLVRDACVYTCTRVGLL